MAVLIEAFKTLGGETLFLTNAAGGLHTEWTPPALVAITDHINFAGVNPLIGRASDDRFVPLTRAYDPALLDTLRDAAREAGVDAARGRLHVVQRPIVRDAGGNPHGEDSRRRSRRHVDRAGGDPGAPARLARAPR